jgi:hypothetical protein
LVEGLRKECRLPRLPLDWTLKHQLSLGVSSLSTNLQMVNFLSLYSLSHMHINTLVLFFGENAD